MLALGCSFGLGWSGAPLAVPSARRSRAGVLVASSSPSATSSVDFEEKKAALIEGLRREYDSFFTPMCVPPSQRAPSQRAPSLLRPRKRPIPPLAASSLLRETELYAPGVTFEDPLISLEGVDAYKNNVNMLAGGNAVGKALFTDCGLTMHSVIEGPTPRQLTTRWTLQFRFKLLPWAPLARFTGVSK